MQRFRRRRRRAAALVLLLFTTCAAMTSIALAASATEPGAEISASDGKIRYGKKVRLRGSVPGLSGAKVTIDFRRQGRGSWRTVRRTETDPAGAYRARVTPQGSGAYRAVPAEGQPSEPVGVRVRSVTKLRVNKHVVRGKAVRIQGRVRPGGARRAVRIKLPGRDRRAKTNGSGRFKETWRPSRTGRGKVRAIAKGNRVAAGSRSRSRPVVVYRRASASWYGPGLYGNGTACGGTLTASTQGVAHRSMPCGTKLTLRHGSRSVRVRVIDRGPFVGGREFDLTGATKGKLGFGSTGTVLTSR